jgi:hypothetical protein
VRASLLDALIRLGDESALASLIRMLTRSKRWAVRTAVMHTLQDLHDDLPPLRSVIEAALADLHRKHPEYREAQNSWFWNELVPELETGSEGVSNPELRDVVGYS